MKSLLNVLLFNPRYELIMREFIFFGEVGYNVRFSHLYGEIGSEQKVHGKSKLNINFIRE